MQVEAMMRHDEGLQTIINTSSANDTMQIESSDDLPLPITNGSRDYCFTSPSADRSIRIKTKVARASVGPPHKITMGIMEEEEEVEQLSPNTVLEVMASTPTSSSSIHHEEFAWVSSSSSRSRGKDLSDTEGKKLRIMSESLNKFPLGSPFACVHTNRRKSRPRRSPIIWFFIICFIYLFYHVHYWLLGRKKLHIMMLSFLSFAMSFLMVMCEWNSSRNIGCKTIMIITKHLLLYIKKDLNIILNVLRNLSRSLSHRLILV